MVEHYTYKLINDKVWQIDDIFRNHMYLIEGSKKALLIDTGMGLEGLKEVINEITEKELLVINTHGHIDHTLGNGFFEAVYMNMDDLEVYNAFSSKNSRKVMLSHLVKKILGRYFNEEKIDDIVDELVKLQLKNNIKNIKEKRTIQLGDRELKVILTPGHTQGSICILDYNTNLLFSGDSICDKGVMLSFNYSSDTDEFLKSLDNIIKDCNSNTLVYGGHHTVPLGVDVIYDYKKCAELIRDKKIFTPEENSIFGKGFRYRYKNISLFYSENQVLKNVL